MEPTNQFGAPVGGTAITCDVAAYGVVQATSETLASMRQRPEPVVGEPLPAGFLKHADDQTVAGLAALFKAIHDHGLAGTAFTDWGALAAPRFLGRVTFAGVLQRFACEGAWGISPHLIPHRSLHAISGTVSQALRIHGPNYGVGGGPEGATQALLAAAAMIAGDRVPGVWVVLTGWEPEFVADGSERASVKSTCNALALALVPTRARLLVPRLRVAPGKPDPPGDQHATADAHLSLVTLEGLLGVLAKKTALATTLVWQLANGWCLELQRPGVRIDEPATVGQPRWRSGPQMEPGRTGAGTEKEL